MIQINVRKHLSHKIKQKNLLSRTLPTIFIVNKRISNIAISSNDRIGNLLSISLYFIQTLR